MLRGIQRLHYETTTKKHTRTHTRNHTRTHTHTHHRLINHDAAHSKSVIFLICEKCERQQPQQTRQRHIVRHIAALHACAYVCVSYVRVCECLCVYVARHFTPASVASRWQQKTTLPFCPQAKRAWGGARQ